jgi:hypothetical protein
MATLGLETRLSLAQTWIFFKSLSCSPPVNPTPTRLKKKKKRNNKNNISVFSCRLTQLAPETPSPRSLLYELDNTICGWSLSNIPLPRDTQPSTWRMGALRIVKADGYNALQFIVITFILLVAIFRCLKTPRETPLS